MLTKVGPAFILWDVVSCPLPTEMEQCGIYDNIRTALFTHTSCTGINTKMALGANNAPGPTTSLIYRGMPLVFCPAKLQDWKMIHEMRYWAKCNPAPATLFVISGSKAISSTLEKLHTRNYNILLAHPDGLSTDLAATASCVWNFTSLLRGESPYLVRREMVPHIFAFPKPEVPSFVLWDARSCPLPTDERCLDVVDNLYSAVFTNCSCTMIKMVAVGANDIPNPISNLLGSDMSLLLSSPENHVTEMIYVMNHWAMYNPASAYILVISDDVALSSSLEKLQSRNYNILVAHPPGVHSADLVATASCVWDFESLLCGKSPYFVSTEMVLRRAAEELSKQTPSAIVRPKKKKKKNRKCRRPRHKK
ncbi:hypothetical protein OROGR_002665 [Orobanche gracilis]